MGEGINSGMEDAFILGEILANNRLTPFAHMNQLRLPDMHAITKYAKYLNEEPPFLGERVARGLAMVLNGAFTSETISNMLFGPMGKERRS